MFLRAMGAIYLIAFLAARNQFRALIGERGMLPVPEYVRRVRFVQSPSLFHWRYTDRLFAATTWTGIALASAATSGLVDHAPAGLGIAVWLALWALYLSIVNVGQTWWGFGWETLLLEAGVLTVFVGPAGVAPSWVVLVLIRWLLFRVEFGAGLIKMRGDPCWRDLTCLTYHHETQPMPGPLSRRFHRLPVRMHKAEALGNHVAQLVVPFFLFTPQPIAGIAAATIIVTQLWLVVSGNFAWLNALTIALAIPALGDGILRRIVPVDPPGNLVDAPMWHDACVVGLAVLVALLSIRPALNLVSPRQVMNSSFDPLRLVNTYGAFGSVTKIRREVIVEGTIETVLSPTTEWREYEFKGKPGDPQRRPRQFAPYHLRLDWLMWFLALSPRSGRSWFRPFLERLLRNDRDTLKLLRHNPFPDAPPAYVRARLFRYRYTTGAERRATGAFWHREAIGEMVKPLRRDDVPG